MKITIFLEDDEGNKYEGVVKFKKSKKNTGDAIPITVQKKSSNIKNPRSIMDFLIVLKKQGFFKTPRTRKDILERLSSMNQHYDGTSLDSPLNRAFKSKKLGRISKKGLYMYVSR